MAQVVVEMQWVDVVENNLGEFKLRAGVAERATLPTNRIAGIFASLSCAFRRLKGTGNFR